MTTTEKEQKYGTLIAEYSDRLYRICCCYVRDADDRRDVHQQVLIHIWQHLDTFQGASSISTWMYRIAVNTCLGHLRSEQRRHSRILAPSEETETLILNHPAEAQPDGYDEELRFLYESINALPDPDKTLISLYLEDVGTREMADVLGISEANVRVRLHRIKNGLKAAVERNHNGPG